MRKLTPKEITTPTYELVSKIKEELNHGARCGDLATKYNMTYSMIYNMSKEHSWREVLPKIDNKVVPRKYARRNRRDDDFPSMSPLLTAWGFTPKK